MTVRRAWLLAAPVLALCAGCERAREAPPAAPDIVPRDVELPEVTANLEAAHDASVDVTIGTTAISVGGHALVPLRDGALDPAEIEGGASGWLVPRLRQGAAGLPRDRPIVLAVDRRTPHRVLALALRSIDASGYRVLARRGSTLVVIPIEIPALRAAVTVGPVGSEPPSGPVRLAAAATNTELLLFSISGLEGSARSPLLRAGRDEVGTLTATLEEVVRRRWSAGSRAPGDETILLMLQPERSVQDLASLAAAALRGRDGRELFERVTLAVGID